jgi:hypothetical protein
VEKLFFSFLASLFELKKSLCTPTWDIVGTQCRLQRDAHRDEKAVPISANALITQPQMIGNSCTVTRVSDDTIAARFRFLPYGIWQ